MNSTHTLPSFPAPHRLQTLPVPSASVQDTLQSRFALRVASRLTESAESLPPDIVERLRHAREQSLLRARSARATAAGVPVGRERGVGGVFGGRLAGWRLKFAAVMPVVALLGGLALIQTWQDSAQVAVAAEIDAALLSDDLPPTAYSDAGFAEFLKTPGE